MSEPSADRECPKCGATVKVTVDDLAKGAKTCPNGHRVAFGDQATKTGRKIAKSRDEMIAKIRKLGK